ncbi:hypothetical protein HMPREF0977_01400 [Clostridium sp. 1_1_41A1FAA]|nr:hypothetical protein HMPREF0977_01400 [Clostridium sp. 1_1_41A1FAA]
MGDTEDTYTKLKYVLESSKCPVVIDADGLNCLKIKRLIRKTSKQNNNNSTFGRDGEIDRLFYK